MYLSASEWAGLSVRRLPLARVRATIFIFLPVLIQIGDATKLVFSINLVMQVHFPSLFLP
jgi:hypothetical protein